MSDKSVRKFSLKRPEEPVTIEEATGVEKSYTVRCIDGVERDTWFNKVHGAVQWENGKAVSMKDQKGLKSWLLSKALHDESGKSVEASKIDSWPCTVSDALFLMAKQISGLDSEDGKDPKEVAKGNS